MNSVLWICILLFLYTVQENSLYQTLSLNTYAPNKGKECLRKIRKIRPFTSYLGKTLLSRITSECKRTINIKWLIVTMCYKNYPKSIF